MAFSPGLYKSTNGVVCGTSDIDMPGTLTAWQKYCISGNRLKLNWNLFGCKKFGLAGFELIAVISVFI